MRTIYFKCSCGKSLAVDETGTGRTAKCPDCGQRVKVPGPAIKWDCPSCGHAMAAPAELEGRQIQCTECLELTTVPAIAPSVPNQDALKYPSCGFGVQADHVICINCGLNFKTGKKRDKADQNIAPQRPKSGPTPAMLVIIFVILGGLAFAGWRLGVANNIFGHAPNATTPADSPATAIQEPKPVATPPTSAPVNPPGSPAPEIDSSALSIIIAKAGSNPNCATALDLLQTGMQQHPRATNMPEAEALLIRLQQAVNLKLAIEGSASLSRHDAEKMMVEAVNQNFQATNRSQAQQLLANIRQEIRDSDNLTRSIEHARTNPNRRSAIKLLQDSTNAFRHATNIAVAQQLLASYQQADAGARQPVVPSIGIGRPMHPHPASIGASPTVVGDPNPPGPIKPPTGIMDNIAVVQSKTETVGTGFILNINGTKYIVTNRHVIEGMESRGIIFEFISGRKPTIKGFEIAKDLDLVRFEIDGSFTSKGLSISSNPDKQIGDAIFVYGNSAGMGAITEIPGQITGWGPALIETSAEFVSGNSGSPIVDANGNVIAVATFVTRSNPKDWVAKGTRFEGVRRFGVRIDNAQWQKVSLEEFIRQAKILNESYTYMNDLFDVFTCISVKKPPANAKETFAYYSRTDGVAKKRTRWSGEIVTMVQYFQQLAQDFRDETPEKSSRHVLSGGGKAGYELGTRKLKSAPLAPKQLLQETRWIDGWYSEQAKTLTEDIDWMYAYFQKIN